MKERGIWDGYVSKVQGLIPCLDNAERRGIRVSEEKRQAFKGELEAFVAKKDKLLQTLYPTHLKRIEPKEGYKKTPVWLREAKHKYQLLFERYLKAHPGGKPESYEKWIYRKYSVVKREFEVETPPLFAEGQPAVMKEPRWTVELPFKPSRDQILDYVRYQMAKGLKGYYIPLTLKEEKETTGADELERLYNATGDPFFQEIGEIRTYSKMLTTDVAGWAPGADEKVHTTFTFRPATGQLSSRRPNVQNLSKHSALADTARAMVVASPRCLLLEFDMSGFHARMLGREAQDISYYELAGLDIHSYLASHLQQVKQPIRLEPSRLREESYREELRLQLSYIKKNFKSVRDEIAKRTILGWGFGMGAMKAFHLYRESYGDLKTAKYTFDMLEDMFPVATKWRTEVRKRAHFQTFLLSHWGFIRYFFEVFRSQRSKNNGRWELKPGADSEKAIAFLPANHAFGMIRSVMVRLEKRGAMERYRFVNNVHDSLVFDCPLPEVQSCIKEVWELMTLPCRTLADPIVCPAGFQVGAGVSLGENWSKRV